MGLKVDIKGEKHWVVTFEGEDHSIPALLSAALSKDPDVEFAAHVMEHPQLAAPKLVIRTKKKTPKEALKKAIESVSDQVDELRGKLKRIRGKK